MPTKRPPSTLERDLRVRFLNPEGTEIAFIDYDASSYAKPYAVQVFKRTSSTGFAQGLDAADHLRGLGAPKPEAAAKPVSESTSGNTEKPKRGRRGLPAAPAPDPTSIIPGGEAP